MATVNHFRVEDDHNSILEVTKCLTYFNNFNYQSQVNKLFNDNEDLPYIFTIFDEDIMNFAVVFYQKNGKDLLKIVYNLIENKCISAILLSTLIGCVNNMAPDTIRDMIYNGFENINEFPGVLQKIMVIMHNLSNDCFRFVIDDPIICTYLLASVETIPDCIDDIRSIVSKCIFSFPDIYAEMVECYKSDFTESSQLEIISRMGFDLTSE